jgi:hypothetical protein
MNNVIIGAASPPYRTMLKTLTFSSGKEFAE